MTKKKARLSGEIPMSYKEFIAAQALKACMPEIYYVRWLIEKDMERVARKAARGE